MSILRKIESSHTLAGDRPEKEVLIAASGHTKVEPFSVEKDDLKIEL